MKIYLEAFVDTNFGDNLFVHTVVSRYPQHTFYMLERDGFEASYQTLQEQEPNVCMLSPESEDMFLTEMDAMMIVGGDIFGEHTDYGALLAKVRKIKEQGGKVLFLGLSLLESYTLENEYNLKLLFTWSDVIVVRESRTAKQVKQIAPRARVIASTDMAFATDVAKHMDIEPIPNSLGVSVRRKIPRNTEDAYFQYCKMVAKTVMQYLDNDSRNTVRFLALSKGVFDDEVVAKDIISICPAKYQERMTCITFMGNVDGYIEEIQRCEKLLCTRFHALVFAILLQKPFAPIAYEEKTKRLLREIGYHGVCPNYEEQWNVVDLLQELEKISYARDTKECYLKKANRFFPSVDVVLQKRKKSDLNKKILINTYRVIHKLKK